jgi:2-dehydro-3-deoxyphosphogluconate aldolase / (4S)-4-hydroxy-2-oxoglutarate aldolase
VSAGGPRPALPPALLEQRVVAILRGFSAERLPPIVDALHDAGITVIEVTLDRPDAVEAVAALSAELGQRMVLGAGTVLTLAQARAAVAAGAAFLVAPHTDTDVVGWAAGEGIPMIPGCLSGTEIMTAWRAGASAVKLFPAEPLGPGYLRALTAPLPHVPILPTGGIDAGNAGAYLAAGAVAVGLGGSLCGDGEPEGIRRRAAEVLQAVAR